MTTTAADLTGLPQGDLRLLDSQTAQRLLASTELARFAYVAADGTPRVFPIMFYWAGVSDFTARFPGGLTAEQFARRGHA
ncbi:MAG TPA: hypothetical protein VGH27_24885 [Streptosporangiaceae bacterium]|jgi:hypothetical protein